jgi:hippurate hydrolase
MIRLLPFLLVGLLAAAPVAGQTTAEIDASYPELHALYQDLHRNPELGFQEVQTAAKLAARLKALGFEGTTGVGRTGIVALLKNAPGRP